MMYSAGSAEIPETVFVLQQASKRIGAPRCTSYLPLPVLYSSSLCVFAQRIFNKVLLLC